MYLSGNKRDNYERDFSFIYFILELVVKNA